MFCNTFHQKNDIFFLNDFFPKGEEIFDFSKTNFVPFLQEKLQGLCPCGVPDYLSNRLTEKKEPIIKRKSVKENLQKFIPYLRKNNFTDAQRKYGLRQISLHTIKVASKVDRFNWRIFDGRQKGTRAYNTYYKARIIDRCKKYIEADCEILALTVTCSVKDVGGDRVLAWATYRDKVSRLLKNIRRRYGGGYVSVLESTKKGFPHAHIILALPRGSIPGYDKMKNRQKIFFGSLVNLIQKFKPANQFRLEKICGKNTAWYLVKYISKFETNNFLSLQDNKGDMATETRKAVDCLLYTTIVGARQFTLSQEGKRERLSLQNDLFTLQDYDSRSTKCEQTAPPTTALPREQSFSAQRFSLIERCINLPACCRSNVLLMSNYDFLRLFPHKSDIEVERNPSDLAKFRHYARRVDCPGCIFRHIANFIQNGDDPVINFSYRTLKEPPKRWFDDCDMLDDEDFMRHFLSALNTIMSCINERGMSLVDFTMDAIYFGVYDPKDDIAATEHWNAILEKKREST